MAKEGEDIIQNKIINEDQNADSNSSDNSYTGINLKSKKKSLTDMLKKLHDGNSKSTQPEIPHFLQKDSSKEQEYSKITQNGVNNDSNHVNQTVGVENKKESKESSCEDVKDNKTKSSNSVIKEQVTSNSAGNTNTNICNDKITDKINNSATTSTTPTTLTSKSTTAGTSDDTTKKFKVGLGQAKVTSLKTNTDIYKCTIDACKSSFANTNDFQAHISLHHPNLTTIPCCFCFNSPPSTEYFPHLTSHIKNVMKCLYCQVSHDTREELLKHLTETHPNQPKKINVCIRILNNLRGKKLLDKGNKAHQINKNASIAGKQVNSNPGRVDVGKENNITNSKSKLNENVTPSSKVDVNNNEDKSNHKSESKEDKTSNAINTSSSIDTSQTEIQDSISKPTTAPNNSNNNNNNDPKNTKTDQSTKSRSRKSLKPVKSLLQSVMKDEVEIKVVSGDLTIVCKQCSFTCGTESSLKQHCLDVHTTRTPTEEGDGEVGLFCCKHCNLKTDNKDEFFNHLAHHKLKSQTVRLYTCPYCPTTCNTMDRIESHIEHQHPSQSFKFEVSQQSSAYLQNLLYCPVCLEAFQWKRCFLKHMENTHKLVELVSHLEDKFGNELDGSLKVSRSLFKNLLPDAPDYDNEVGKRGPVDMDEGSLGTENYHDEGKKTEGLLTDHPLLYNMLSKTPTPSLPASPQPTTSLPALSSPILPMVATGKKDTEYTDRFPPSDLVKYVTKKCTPTIFNCNLCPFECSKTTHFRRHLDIHKRNESLKEGYKCGHCEFMHYRLNCIRFHLGKYHSALPYKIYRIIDDSQIILGVDDDPTLKKSKAKNPFMASPPSKNLPTPSQPSTSQRPERERRPPAKLENNFSYQSTPFVKTGNASLDEILLFERSLPSAMIFPEVVQCPKCDFSNRVRINIVKHLRLHKEVIQNSSITSPAPLEDGDEDGGGEVLKNVTMSYTTRANLSEEYHQFSVKIANHNHYRCKECNFTHRYPSKVKRHFYYKHAATFPYKCGYCSFGAVEGGKVRRHCKLIHASQSELVIKRNVYKRASDLDQSSSSKRSRLEMEDSVMDGVKVRHEWMSAVEASTEDLWLPQFVTELEDDMKCCKLCGYQQVGASCLKEHVISNHLSNYPFSCSYCGFALMDLTRVKRHIDTHHPQESYSAVKRHPTPIHETNHNNDSSQDSTDLNLDESHGSQLDESQLDDSQLDGTEKESEDEEEHIDHSNDHSDNNLKKDNEMKNFLYESLTSIPHEANNNISNNNNDNNNESINNLIINPNKKRYKCHYCGVVSKWNRRDIRLHILHVHMKKKVYTCKHCGFGNSKSKVLVRSHCIKFHPGKSVAVKDDLVLFNSIVPLEDHHGIVTMVMCNKEGAPILQIPQDEEFDVKLIYNSKHQGNKNYINLLNSSNINNISLKSDKWKCRQCTYASTSQLDVKYHIISLHLNIRPFSCPHCHVYINKEDLVIAHIDKYHPDKERKVLNTLDEKAEYLQAHMDCLLQPLSVAATPSPRNPSILPILPTTPKPIMGVDRGEEDELDEGFAKIMQQQTNPRYSSGYFRCMICGYRDPRNDKTKYHIIKTHLNLRQFSCPYCQQYMWGRQQVLTHIQQEHPDRELIVKRTFHQYDDFLRKNIRKFAYNKNNSSKMKCGSSSSGGSGGVGDGGSGGGGRMFHDNLVIAPEMKNKLFQCYYCDFKHALVAKIQSHCLDQHPSDFVRFKQVDNVEDEFKNFSDDEEFERGGSGDGGGGDGSGGGEKKGTFICQHCELVKWTEKDMTKHLNDLHQDSLPSFTFVPSDLFNEAADECSGEEGVVGDGVEMVVAAAPAADDDEEYFPTKKLSLINARQNNSYINAAGIKMTNVANTKFSHMTSNDLLKSKASLYQCKLCAYKSNKMTVMRHHVMSHLRYHPYVCPYCNIAKSVKSFPVKKHVAAKHPGKEVRALHCVDKELEKKICNSYFKMKVSSMGSSRQENTSTDFMYSSPNNTNDNSYGYGDENDDEGGVDDDDGDAEEGGDGGDDGVKKEEMDEDDDDEHDLVIDTSERKPTLNTSTPIKDTYMDTAKETNKDTHKDNTETASETYKCKFCDFRTSLQSSMKHHLMKELNYKPYKCLQCSFRDTIRSSLSKHTQRQHGGEARVVEERNEEKEVLVAKMVTECFIVPIKKPTMIPSTVSPVAKQLATYIPKPPTKQPIQINIKQPIQLNNTSLLPMVSGDSKLFKCPECQYTNSSLKLVRGHMVKHGPYRLKCAYCNYKAHYPSRIRKHNRRQHHGLVAKCLKVEIEEPTPPENLTTLILPPNEGSTDKQQVEEKVNRGLPYSAGKVFLDGVPIDLPLVADSDGWFRCTFCRYESLNRDNFKVHLVTHKPPRWKCYYCDQKYPVVFRVRRHCNMKHPDKPVKWMDVQTQKACGDLTTPENTSKKITTKTSYSVGIKSAINLAINPHKVFTLLRGSKGITARKSSLPLYRQIKKVKRNALGNSGQSVSIDFDGMGDCEVIDGVREPLVEWKSATLKSRLYRMCCHLCDFCDVSSGTEVFERHMKLEHFYRHKLPAVEVLPGSEEAEVWALKRCGFCPFESYDTIAFKKHVVEHTNCQPVQCVQCIFASFSRQAVADHFIANHSAEYDSIKDKFVRKEVDNDDDDDDDDDDDNKDTIIEEMRDEERDNKVELPKRFLYKSLRDDYTMRSASESNQGVVDWSGGSKAVVSIAIDYSIDDYIYTGGDDEDFGVGLTGGGVDDVNGEDYGGSDKCMFNEGGGDDVVAEDVGVVGDGDVVGDFDGNIVGNDDEEACDQVIDGVIDEGGDEDNDEGGRDDDDHNSEDDIKMEEYMD